MKTTGKTEELLHALFLEATHFANTKRGESFLRKKLDETEEYLRQYYDGGSILKPR